MRNVPDRHARKLIALLAFGLLLTGQPATVSAKEKWDPIAPEDLAATECKAYPGSSAEMLIKRQIMDYDSAEKSQVSDFYQRIKIYSPKGADEEGIFKIDCGTEQKVWSIAARLTRQNGTVTEFTKKDFTESIYAKQGFAKIKRQTLAVPDLSPGDILDMKWSETVASRLNWYDQWMYQENLPIRRYEFFLRGAKFDSRMISFNEPKQANRPESEKLATLDLRDIPPFVPEPYMPPDRDARAWFLLLYTNPYMRLYSNSDELWRDHSAQLEEAYRSLTIPNSALKKKAAELTKGAATPEDKLRQLYDFCQHDISNLDYFISAELQKAKKKLDGKIRDQTPAQTFELQSGYSHHINELFAALARAAGFKLRFARSANRFFMCNVRHDNGWLFVEDMLVQAQVGEIWRCYAPGDYYVPAGMLDNAYEGALSLICDPDKKILEENPVSSGEKSPVVRQGRFVLDEEGTLEGEVEISMGGHVGSLKKKGWQAEQRAEIDAEYRATITKRLPAAEVSDLQWENLQGNKLPLIVRYKIKVPAYADVAGTKIILPANVFEHGAPAVFSAENRKHPVFFDHAWSEQDDIIITLPEGYTIEAGNAPANVGTLTGALGVAYELGFKPKSRQLLYKRNFVLGGNGVILFQPSKYPTLKRLFDIIGRSDEHTFVLKSSAASESPVADAAMIPPVPHPFPERGSDRVAR